MVVYYIAPTVDNLAPQTTEGDSLCGIRNSYYKTMMAMAPSIGLFGVKAWDEAYTTKVYRVESSDNERMRVANGYPIIRKPKDMLFLNFGNSAKARLRPVSIMLTRPWLTPRWAAAWVTVNPARSRSFRSSAPSRR